MAHQGPAALGIAVVAMSEELGTAMAHRALEHLLQYGEPPRQVRARLTLSCVPPLAVRTVKVQVAAVNRGSDHRLHLCTEKDPCCVLRGVALVCRRAIPLALALLNVSSPHAGRHGRAVAAVPRHRCGGCPECCGRAGWAPGCPACASG